MADHKLADKRRVSLGEVPAVTMQGMPNRRASKAEGEARRRLATRMITAGAKVRAARLRRRITQKELGRRVGLSQSTVSGMELGEGASLSVLTWERTAVALDLPLDFAIGRDAHEPPPDAGHLDMQVLMLRLGRHLGVTGTFELPTKPLDPTRSTDVGWRDDVRRRLTLIECVNRFGNINASIRSSDRKRADALQLAEAFGHGDAYCVHACWVVRDTRRNRELLTKYREIFVSRFPGSSRRWVNALTTGAEPPPEPGIVWCDTAATRLFEWRP
jgi:transcriptional regulator with XRE-family HTH domain